MKLLAFDTSGYLYRSFYSWPIDPAAQLRSTLQRAIDSYKPDRIFFALDVGKETFRNRIYPGYKANRPPTPEGFSEAKKAMELVLHEIDAEIIGIPDYESDDILGSLCAKYSTDEIRIMSVDKDLHQLVCENVECHDDVTGITYNEAGVIEKWGVMPRAIPDILGCAGDASDGYPGVVGIGIKIATALIQYFGTIDHLYEDLTSVSYLYKNPERIIKKLEAGRENAFMSKDLATIRRNVL